MGVVQWLDDTFPSSSFNEFPIAPSHSERSRVAQNGSANAVDRAQVFARNARADGTAVRTRQVARQGLPRRNKATQRLPLHAAGAAAAHQRFNFRSSRIVEVTFDAVFEAARCNGVSNGRCRFGKLGRGESKHEPTSK
jgi:hypothetical protein